MSEPCRRSRCSIRATCRPDWSARACRWFHSAAKPSAPTSGMRSVTDAGDLLVEGPAGLVDRVLGHDPVGRVLAAGDDDQPGGGVGDDVLARQLARRVGLAGQQRPQPGVDALDVGVGRAASAARG